MANMTPVSGRSHWEFQKVYTGVGAQEIINLPLEPHNYTVQLTPSGGSALVAVSIDGVNWVDWPAGNVASPHIEGTIAPVRYMRVTNSTATSSTISIWGY